MAVENVKKFFELVKSDEKLSREIAKIKDEIQNKGETVDYEQIISKKVIPMAKKHGLDFTMEDFLKYTNSMVQQGELSDDDLLNVSGGMNFKQGVVMGLTLLTLGTSGLAMSGFGPGGGGAGSGGQVAPSTPDTSYSMSIDNSTEAPAATTQEVKSDNNGVARRVMLNTEVDDDTEKSAIADETNKTTENNNFNEEDITQIEQEVNEVADENARTAEKDNKVAEATEEDDDFLSNIIDETINGKKEIVSDSASASEDIKDLIDGYIATNPENVEDKIENNENAEEAEKENYEFLNMIQNPLAEESNKVDIMDEIWAMRNGTKSEKSEREKHPEMKEENKEDKDFIDFEEMNDIVK